MKKLIPVFFLCVFILGGCSKKPAAPEVSQLAAELAKAGVFSTEISEVDPAVAEQVYAISAGDVEAGAFRFSSGASADELALVRAADENAAKAVAEAFTERVEFQRRAYADYMPGEVPKLEAAIVRTEGTYVLLCIAEDASGVTKVMDKYF